MASGGEGGGTAPEPTKGPLRPLEAGRRRGLCGGRGFGGRYKAQARAGGTRVRFSRGPVGGGTRGGWGEEFPRGPSLTLPPAAAPARPLQLLLVLCQVTSSLGRPGEARRRLPPTPPLRHPRTHRPFPQRPPPQLPLLRRVAFSKTTYRKVFIA